MLKSEEAERVKALADLVGLTKPMSEILEDLSRFHWDGTENLVTLGSKDMHRILTSALEGEITSADLEKWADAVEVHESIAFESDAVKDMVFLLANPEINGSLNLELFRSLLSKLELNK